MDGRTDGHNLLYRCVVVFASFLLLNVVVSSNDVSNFKTPKFLGLFHATRFLTSPISAFPYSPDYLPSDRCPSLATISERRAKAKLPLGFAEPVGDVEHFHVRRLAGNFPGDFGGDFGRFGGALEIV